MAIKLKNKIVIKAIENLGAYWCRLYRRTLLICSLFLSLSGCISPYSPYTHNKLGDYQISQRFNIRPIFKEFVHFDVSHLGGKKLDSCLKSIVSSKDDKTDFEILVPCVFFDKYEVFLHSFNREGNKVYQEVIQALRQLPTFFDQYSLTHGATYQVRLLLLPYNMTYHYQEMYFHQNEPKILIGVNVDFDKPDYDKLINDVIAASTHESLHFFDFVNKEIRLDKFDNRFQLEYFGYLAQYCANIDYIQKVKLSTIEFPYTFQHEFFNSIIDSTYADLAVGMYIHPPSEEERRSPTASELANLLLQRDVLKVIDGSPEYKLNNQQAMQFSKFCHAKLSNYLSKH